MHRLLYTLSISLLAGSLFAADPFVGTWKPDVQKWRRSPGGSEHVKSEMFIIEATGREKYRRSARTIVDGKATAAPPDDWIVDGKKHRLLDGTELTIQRMAERHLTMAVSGPKGSTVDEWIVSPDSRTLTQTRKGSGLNSGRPLDELLVYSKQ